MKNKNGFTLIEVLASIVIIGLIISVLFNINIAGFQFVAYNQDRVELQNQARLITSNLEKQIRQSQATKVISVDSKDGLALDIPDEISSNNIVFFLNNNQLKIGFTTQDIADITSISSTSLSNIRNISDSVIVNDGSYNFFNENNDLVEFQFKLEKDNSSYEIINKIYPRAKN